MEPLPVPSIPALPSPAETLAGTEEQRRYSHPPGVHLFALSKLLALCLWVAGQPTASLLFLALPAPWFAWQTLVARSRGFGPTVGTFRTNCREVWLTIDDGPHPETTPALLELLDQHAARATFFVVGRNVERFPELVREIVRRGHSLGNHSDSHPLQGLWCASWARLGREIDRCNEALRQAGASTSWFRAPIGIKHVMLHRRLAHRHMHLIAWSARGYDSVLPPGIAAARIAQQIRPGCIVLCHEGQHRRVEVVKRVLADLQSREYACVLPKVGQLVS